MWCVLLIVSTRCSMRSNLRDEGYGHEARRRVSRRRRADCNNPTSSPRAKHPWAADHNCCDEDRRRLGPSSSFASRLADVSPRQLQYISGNPVKNYYDTYAGELPC